MRAVVRLEVTGPDMANIADQATELFRQLTGDEARELPFSTNISAMPSPSSPGLWDAEVSISLTGDQL